MRDEGDRQLGAGHTIQWMSIASIEPWKTTAPLSSILFLGVQ